MHRQSGSKSACGMETDINMERELTCICCPLGCQLKVTVEDAEVRVTGNTCRRGEEYGKKEVTDPRRIATSRIRVENGTEPMSAVKTVPDVPKHKVMDCLKVIHQLKVKAPVAIGDVVLEDCAGTGAGLVITKAVGEQK